MLDADDDFTDGAGPYPQPFEMQGFSSSHAGYAGYAIPATSNEEMAQDTGQVEFGQVIPMQESYQGHYPGVRISKQEAFLSTKTNPSLLNSLTMPCF